MLAVSTLVSHAPFLERRLSVIENQQERPDVACLSRVLRWRTQRALGGEREQPDLHGGACAENECSKELYARKYAEQTVQAVLERQEHFGSGEHGYMTVMEAAERFLLPEVLKQGLQRAHAAQADSKNDWFVATAFLHDLGSILSHPEFAGEEPHWVEGESFPVGCPLDSQHLPYPHLIPQNGHPRSTEMYAPNCGLDNVMLSWGKSEYMYRVLNRACEEGKCELPQWALWILRYNRFYALHQGGGYTELLDEEVDRRKIGAVTAFTPYDRTQFPNKDQTPNTQELLQRYRPIIERFLPEPILW